MYIVDKAYDDNTAYIINTLNFQRKYYKENELISFAKQNEVWGVESNGKTLDSLEHYKMYQFESNESLKEYSRENAIYFDIVEYSNDMWLAFQKQTIKEHVDYYVCFYRGDEITYIAPKGYTIYRQAAKTFSKKEAGKKAAILRKNSKTGKYWNTLRVVS